MLTGRRLPIAVAVLGLFVGGVALASCGGDGDEAAPPPITITTTITQPPGTPAVPTEIEVVVVNGAPEGGIVRETVERGDRVVLVVTSDVADEVHLHGYDVTRDVAAGGTVELPFTATIPGRFEVELEDRGVQIADLTVTP